MSALLPYNDPLVRYEEAQPSQLRSREADRWQTTLMHSFAGICPATSDAEPLCSNATLRESIKLLTGEVLLFCLLTAVASAAARYAAAAMSDVQRAIVRATDVSVEKDGAYSVVKGVRTAQGSEVESVPKAQALAHGLAALR